MTVIQFVYLVGHILFGGYFLMGAYSHLFKNKDLVGYAQFKGVKNAKVAVIGSGLLLLFGGLAFVGLTFGLSLSWGAWALIIFFVPVTFKMHAFWKDTDPQTKIGNRINFYKNLAIVGALLMMI